MYCPKCGHEQAADARRFCSKCGLSLDGISDLIETSDTRFKREKKEVIGIGMLIGMVLVLLFYYLMFGALTLSRDMDKDVIAAWIIGLLTALILGGVGVYNLAGSGFFRKFKERQIKIRLESLKQRGQELEERLSNRQIEEMPALQISETAKMVETPSITEATTRDLDRHPRPPHKVRDTE